MTLKEMIKKELVEMLEEEAAVNFDKGTMFDSMDEVIATLGGMAELHGTRQPRVAEQLASIVSQLQQLKGQLAEGEGGGRHRAKRLYRLGYEDGLRGQLPNNLKLRDNEHYKAGNEEGEKERDAGRGYGD